MAGMGKRMRPHTLTVPKPLIPVAGKPIVQRLVEDIAKVCPEKIDQIGFVVGDFGPEVEQRLIETAAKVGATGKIFYQTEAEGTAHAVHCAKDLLNGPVIIAFADTLFSANFTMDTNPDGMIWVQRVEDPRPFGVVLVNDKNEIQGMVEKPVDYVSDLAIIGIYYIKNGVALREQIQHLLDNDIREKGEYQLTNALESLREAGQTFITGAVDEWLDCGNKNATVYTNQRVLSLVAKTETLRSQSVRIENSVVIEPCFLGANVTVRNAVVGPYVSLGEGTTVEDSRISNTIVQTHARIKNSVIENSMVGNHAEVQGNVLDLSLSDYSTLL